MFNHFLLNIGGIYIIGRDACRESFQSNNLTVSPCGLTLTSHLHDLFCVILMKRFFLFVGEVIHLSDVKDFPATLWLIFIICVAYYVAIFPFIALGL